MYAHNQLHYSQASHDDAEAHALAQAARCRRLAASISDRETSDLLSRMAEGYDREASALRRQF